MTLFGGRVFGKIINLKQDGLLLSTTGVLKKRGNLDAEERYEKTGEDGHRCQGERPGADPPSQP